MKTLSAFLLKGEHTIRQNKNLNEASAMRLEKLAQSLHKWDRTSIELTTGMWLSKDWFPQRLPAIAVPTLRVMERLDALWVHDHRYTLYQAREFLITEQWITPKEAIWISNHMEWYIREYIRVHYLHLEKRIDFQFDKKIERDEFEKVKESLRVSDSPDIQKIIAYAMSKGRDNESAISYAAANIVCNLYAWKAHHIVIGWEKERPFFRLGQAYEVSIPDRPQSIFLIQSTWHIPPYYPKIGEEPYFDCDWNPVAWLEVPINKHITYDQSIL